MSGGIDGMSLVAEGYVPTEESTLKRLLKVEVSLSVSLLALFLSPLSLILCIAVSHRPLGDTVQILYSLFY